MSLLSHEALSSPSQASRSPGPSFVSPLRSQPQHQQLWIIPGFGSSLQQQNPQLQLRGSLRPRFGPSLQRQSHHHHQQQLLLLWVSLSPGFGSSFQQQNHHLQNRKQPQEQRELSSSSCGCSGSSSAFSRGLLAPSYVALRPLWSQTPSAFVVCQAHPSYSSSVILFKQKPLFSVIPFQQEDELIRKDGVRPSSKSRLRVPSPALLQAKEDCYDGVIVDPTSLPSADVGAFVDCLRVSIAHWRSQHKKGVWLKLPVQNADLVPAAIKEGFQYHHAEPTHVMMTYWIPDSPSTLPPNASHQVGMGAFILNEKREVLAVQERNGPMKGSGVWKMPTGLINQAEDLFSGAVREVKEETGVDTEFLEVAGFSHLHDVSFGKSDIFFLCVLRPTSMEIIEQNEEIEAVKWMPLEEFRSQPFFNENSLRKKMVDVCIATSERRNRGFSTKQLQNDFQQHASCFYCCDEDSK